MTTSLLLCHAPPAHALTIVILAKMLFLALSLNEGSLNFNKAHWYDVIYMRVVKFAATSINQLLRGHNHWKVPLLRSLQMSNRSTKKRDLSIVQSNCFKYLRRYYSLLKPIANLLYSFLLENDLLKQSLSRFRPSDCNKAPSFITSYLNAAFESHDETRSVLLDVYEAFKV